MKLTKFRIPLFLLIGSLILFGTACDTNKDDDPTPDPEPEPKGFLITKITVSNVPQCYLSDQPIDNPGAGDYADVLIKVTNSNVGTFSTGVAYDKTQVAFNNLNWSFFDKLASTEVRILDEDNLGPVSTNNTLVITGFTFEDLKKEPDNAWSVQIQNGFSPNCYPNGNTSWLRVSFEFLY